MLSRRLLVFVVLVLSSSAARGESPDSDPQAVAVLQQALAASGAALNPVRNFVASGTITYFWAGQPVQGTATIRARGHEQFRIDADLPNGRRSIAINRRDGKRKNSDGKLDEIPAHNTSSGGAVATLPYPAIAAALSDATTRISYAGLIDVEGRATHRVGVTTVFSPDKDPGGVLAKLSRLDYWIDAQTGLVSKVEDATHPNENLLEEYSRELELRDYAAFNGVAVPALVREKIAGQTMWELRLTSITFNGNVADTDFTLQ